MKRDLHQIPGVLLVIPVLTHFLLKLYQIWTEMVGEKPVIIVQDFLMTKLMKMMMLMETIVIFVVDFLVTLLILMLIVIVEMIHVIIVLLVCVSTVSYSLIPKTMTKTMQMETALVIFVITVLAKKTMATTIFKTTVTVMLWEMLATTVL